MDIPNSFPLCLFNNQYVLTSNERTVELNVIILKSYDLYFLEEKKRKQAYLNRSI